MFIWKDGGVLCTFKLWKIRNLLITTLSVSTISRNLGKHVGETMEGGRRMDFGTSVSCSSRRPSEFVTPLSYGSPELYPCPSLQ